MNKEYKKSQKKEYKALKRKAEKALDKLNDIRFCNGAYDLQLEAQAQLTKVYLYAAIDNLKSFIDNIGIEN